MVQRKNIIGKSKFIRIQILYYIRIIGKNTINVFLLIFYFNVTLWLKRNTLTRNK